MNEKEQLVYALNLCYFYLRFRPRTEKEILRYLEKKAKRFSFATKIIHLAIEELKKQDLINDKKFVKWFVEDRMSSKKKSAPLLKFQLNKHGVEKSVIQEYFEDSFPDQHESAHAALRSKWSQYLRFEKRKRFEKAAGFLQRKGFPYDVIKKAIAELEQME